MSDKIPDLNQQLDDFFVSYEQLSDSLVSSMESFYETTFFSELANVQIEELSNALYDALNSAVVSDNLKLLSDEIVENLKEAFLTLDIPDFHMDYHIQDDYVELSSESVASVSEVLNSQNNTLATAPKQAMPSKMHIHEFITLVLIPLIFVLMQMLQNSYYHKIDALEAQKALIEEREYQEQMLQYEQEQTEALEQISNLLTSLSAYYQEDSENSVSSDSLIEESVDLSPDSQDDIAEQVSDSHKSDAYSSSD